MLPRLSVLCVCTVVEIEMMAATIPPTAQSSIVSCTAIELHALNPLVPCLILNYAYSATCDEWSLQYFFTSIEEIELLVTLIAIFASIMLRWS